MWLRHRRADDPSTKMQREIARQLNPWTPRRLAAWACFVLAAIIAAQHLLAHAGWRPLPMGMGAQDLLVGYPAAAVLAIVGLFALGPRPGA
jgi:hypothetical protein